VPGDTVSTFIDVTQASLGGTVPGEDLDVANRAQVLARVSDGATSMVDLLKETQLSEDAVRTALDWLSQNGLVSIQLDASGVERLALTSHARDALGES
jgi:lambda repressor-like predicted transcriptional regulator